MVGLRRTQSIIHHRSTRCSYMQMLSFAGVGVQVRLQSSPTTRSPSHDEGLCNEELARTQSDICSSPQAGTQGACPNRRGTDHANPALSLHQSLCICKIVGKSDAVLLEKKRPKHAQEKEKMVGLRRTQIIHRRSTRCSYMQMLSFAGVGVQVRLQPRRPREVPRTTKDSAMKSLHARNRTSVRLLKPARKAPVQTGAEPTTPIRRSRYTKDMQDRRKIRRSLA